MKKIIFILCSIIITAGCDPIIKTGVLRTSFDIEQAKKNGVFISEYIPSVREIIFDSDKIYIQEIWIEKLWEYENRD